MNSALGLDRDEDNLFNDNLQIPEKHRNRLKILEVPDNWEM